MAGWSRALYLINIIFRQSYNVRSVITDAGLTGHGCVDGWVFPKLKTIYVPEDVNKVFSPKIP